MTAKKKAKASSKRIRNREKVARYRKSLRKQGLRPVQIWVPDTTNPAFAAECRRQSLMLVGSPAEKEIMDWIERVADLDGWTA